MKTLSFTATLTVLLTMLSATTLAYPTSFSAAVSSVSASLFPKRHGLGDSAAIAKRGIPASSVTGYRNVGYYVNSTLR